MGCGSDDVVIDQCISLSLAGPVHGQGDRLQGEQFGVRLAGMMVGHQQVLDAERRDQTLSLPP